VLLPEAISIDFFLKDTGTGEILKEALMGKRGAGTETILPWLIQTMVLIPN